MRYITANTSMYVNPKTDPAVNFTKTQSLTLTPANNLGTIGITACQRSVLGTSVQGPYGTGATMLGGGNQRFNGVIGTSTNSTSAP